MSAFRAFSSALCAFGFLFFTVSQILAAGAEPFVLAVLPDTQNYVKYKGSEKKFLDQTQWIRDNIGKLNIKFVIHEGDITDNNSPAQWEKARACMAVLDGQIPYALCVGNHDIACKGDHSSLIGDYFKETDYGKYPCKWGKMPGRNCFWFRFEAGGSDYLIMSLDLGASDEMLKWADGILEANKDAKTILVTHELLDEKGELSTQATNKSARAYGPHQDGTPRNTGSEVWEKHIKKHPNYIMALCGHYNGIASRKTMKGESGNTVHIMMANYQYHEGGGNGFLRLLSFDPENKSCHVSTYSPFLKKDWKDDANDFIIKLD